MTILNKVTKHLQFEKSKDTSQDSFANNVVMSTKCVQRDTSLDSYANYVTLNMRCEGQSRRKLCHR